MSQAVIGGWRSVVYIKGYLSKYLISGTFDILAENVSITWRQDCLGFPYPITIDFTEMTNKTTYVYRKPWEPHSNFLFTNIDKKHTLVFPTLKMNQIHNIRLAAHCKLTQIWEVGQSNCKYGRVTFGKDEGWLKSAVTLDVSKSQRFPSGYSSVSKSTVTNAYPKGRNFTEESCSLTLHATAYIRLLFRTGVKGIAPVWPFDLFKCIHNTFFTKD